MFNKYLLWSGTVLSTGYTGMEEIKRMFLPGAYPPAWKTYAMQIIQEVAWTWPAGSVGWSTVLYTKRLWV